MPTCGCWKREIKQALSSGKRAYDGEIVHCRVTDFQHTLNVSASFQKAKPLAKGDVANNIPGTYAVKVSVGMPVS